MRGWLAAGLICLTGTLGCGSSDRVEVFPVQGKITFEGAPLEGGGAISFIPTTNQGGAAAGGEIQLDGSYQLTTYEPGDGSMVGDFKVIITQSVFKEPEATPDGTKPAKVGQAVVPEDKRIPVTYSNPRDTTLTAKVAAEPNVINFDLQRK